MSASASVACTTTDSGVLQPRAVAERVIRAKGSGAQRGKPTAPLRS